VPSNQDHSKQTIPNPTQRLTPLILGEVLGGVVAQTFLGVKLGKSFFNLKKTFDDGNRSTSSWWNGRFLVLFLQFFMYTSSHARRCFQIERKKYSKL
jgi:hypothetical protein